MSELASQSAAQAAKEQGNQAFKERKFEEALKHYSEAIKLCPQGNKDERATFYGNRSAAYFHLQKYDECVCDCEKALQLKPKYKKVAVRQVKALKCSGGYVTIHIWPAIFIHLVIGKNQDAIDKVRSYLSTVDFEDVTFKSLGSELGMYSVNACVPKEEIEILFWVLELGRWYYHRLYSCANTRAEGLIKEISLEDFINSPMTVKTNTNMAMYNYWLKDRAGEPKGIFQRVATLVSNDFGGFAMSREHSVRNRIIRDLGSWDKLRFDGPFVAYKKEPEGTILISVNRTWGVFLVLGLEKNIFDMTHRVSAVSTFNMNMLPWNGRLVCDGFVIHNMDKTVSKARLKETYEKAVANNSIIKGFSHDQVSRAAAFAGVMG
eukprot:m.43628 g.43628  ORF g.43628 m.43628 type:complete len:377 (+) comp9989_c0_seq1:45-1175(+)